MASERKTLTLDPHCSGFTLIEILVAIAITGILIALLLPAVQYSREAARRSMCQSHLRQIALGIHTHEGVHRHLPTGGWGWTWHGEPDRGYGRHQPGGWAYNVLPFIEQGELRNVGMYLPPAQRPQVLSATVAVPIHIFSCPSRRPPRPLPFVHPVDYVNITRPQRVVRSDYAACSGDQQPDVILGQSRGPPSLAVGDSPAYVWQETNRSGVVFRRSTVSFGEIRDGLTNTYLAGEKYVAIQHYESGTAHNDDQHLLVGYDSDTLRTTDWNFPPLPDRYNIGSDHSFGSAHPSGLHMAMADGSVQFVSYLVDGEVHRTRGNRRDGVVVTATD